MAIFHMSVQIITRNAGRSAVAAAAYRTGDILTNEWDGLTHDYSVRDGLNTRKSFFPIMHCHLFRTAPPYGMP